CAAALRLIRMNSSPPEPAPSAPPLALERNPVTWLPGMVFAWGAGMILQGIFQAKLSMLEFSAWGAYATLYGYASGVGDFGRALVYLPLVLGMAMVAQPQTETRFFGYVLLVIGMILGIVLRLTEQRHQNAAVLVAILGIFVFQKAWI